MSKSHLSERRSLLHPDPRMFDSQIHTWDCSAVPFLAPAADPIMFADITVFTFFRATTTLWYRYKSTPGIRASSFRQQLWLLLGVKLD